MARTAMVKQAGKKAGKKAAKKVAKKAVKKVAKKAAKKAPAKHAEGHDLRRAYEHLHRVGVLHKELGRAALAQVETLSRLAHGALHAEDARTAAELLRAAEHLAFGSLALETADRNAGDDLVGAAQREYEHLSARAAERWGDRGSTSREVAAIYKAMLQSGRDAFNAGAFHRGLEFARGAEALTHATAAGQARLASSKQATRRLRG